MLVQKLRLKRGWSQQQLAEASGLSVRTIQRIESGEPASTETLKSLAAVFEVHFSTLNPEPEPMEASPAANPAATATNEKIAEQQEREAFRYVRRLRGFYLHLYNYIAINLVLVAMNLFYTPDRLWVVWTIFGWGIGILMHGVSVYRPTLGLGPDWERRQVERRLGRPL